LHWHSRIPLSRSRSSRWSVRVPKGPNVILVAVGLSPSMSTSPCKRSPPAMLCDSASSMPIVSSNKTCSGSRPMCVLPSNLSAGVG
jgi:hypothetical protein